MVACHGRYRVRKVRISAVIITKNEEKNIGRALASVAWTDEVLVLDCGSSDRTVELALKSGAIVETDDWKGYVANKNAAAEPASGDWILSIDADEEITPELRTEIEIILEDPGGAAGYRIPRKNHYLGHWIRRCGWYPDYQLRLWRRGAGRWVGGRVHERVEVNGPVGRTRAPINHYSYSSIAEHIDRMNTYAGLAARDKFEAGKKAGVFRLLLAAPAQFIRLYFLRGGILDGIPGLLVSALGGYYAFLKQARLWELHYKNRHQGDIN